MFLMTCFWTFLSYSQEKGLHNLPYSDENKLLFIVVERHGDELTLCDTPLDGFLAKKTIQGFNIIKDGKYLCAEPLEKVLCDRTYPSTWEKFTAVNEGDAVRFLALHQNPISEMLRLKNVVEDLIAKGEPVKLYFGAGLVPRPGFLNFDLFVMAPEFAVAHPDEYFTIPFADIAWDIPENSVDYIFHEDFIEHIPQIMQWQFLAEALRVLKVGSWHRVNTPCIKASMKRHSEFKKGALGVYTGEREHEHIAMLTHSSLKEIAETIGYREVVFTTRDHGISRFAVEDFRPGSDRDDVIGNIYADLLK